MRELILSFQYLKNRTSIAFIGFLSYFMYLNTVLSEYSSNLHINVDPSIALYSWEKALPNIFI